MKEKIALAVLACLTVSAIVLTGQHPAPVQPQKPTEGIWLYYQSSQVDKMPLNCIDANGGGYECYMVGVGGGHAFKD